MDSTKKFILNKKVIAIVLLLITLLTNVSPVLAASGSGSFVGGQYASGMYTTDHTADQTGILIRRLINYNTGERYTVFCAEHEIDFETGSIYNGNYYTPTDATIKKACKVAYFGWYSKYGDYVVDGGILAADMLNVKKDYAYTQQYIWEVLGQSNATFKNATYQNEYVNFKQDIENKIANMQRRPSFDATTITLEAGESKVLTDTNGVLADYSSIDNTKDNIRFQHTKGENTLTITVSENCTVESLNISDNTFKNWGLVKEETIDHDTTIYFSFTTGVQNQLMAMHYNDPVTMALSLKINLTGKLELTKLDTDNNLIDGSVFNITGPNNYNQDVTVTNGKIVIENLKKGTYYIKEKSAPTGYLLNTNTYQVEIKVGETTKQTVTNTEPTGKILVYKISENNDKIGGAVFSVTAAEDIKNKAGTTTFYTKGQEVKKITTEAGTGIAQIDNLPLGRYNVKEVQAPEGYLLNEKTYTANLVYKDDETPVITIEIEGIVNEEPTGTISIIKRDSETGAEAQGDATLQDAVYKVYANEDIWNKAHTKQFYTKGDLVATRTTNEKGECQDVTDLPLGKYIVKEEKSPIGYLIDKNEYEVNLQYKDQYTKIITGKANSTDKVKKMQIHIFKSGIDEQSGEVQGLEGAEFTIKLKSDVQEALDKGYSYIEIWSGIDEYGNKVKVDEKRVAEAQVIAPTYDTLVTDSEGNAYSAEKLPYGYYIGKETKTPKDFETASDFTFSITKDESEVEEVAQKVKDIIINNEQLEAYVKLVKKDLDTGKIVTLNNATFQIKAAEDIYDRGNGKILYKKGEVITQKIGSTVYDSFTTNADNLVVPNNSYNNDNDDLGAVITPLKLDVGKYEINEILIPQGFLQLEEPIQFTIEGIRDYDKDSQDDYVKTVEIKNDQPTGTILLDKSVAIRENVDTSLVDLSDLSGIKFRLTAKENITSPIDGSLIYNAGQEVGTYNLTKEGNLSISELPMGVYEMQEIETLDGLVLNDTKYEIRFTQKDTITKVYEQKLDLKNDTTLTEISKIDITGEKELEGAKLSVLDEQGNVIDQWTSTSKAHSIEGLTVGKEYTLCEDLAPLGFVKATDIKFTVENTTETQKLTMIDKVVTMTKEDIGGTEIEGAEMSVTNEDGEVVDSWTSTKEPHKINGLEEGKTYTLHENYAPDGFVIATDVEFTVTLDKETQEIVLVDKMVTMTKEDIGGNEIEGAEMSVTNEKGEVVDSWTSTNEPHKINGLEEGKTYTLHENYAPDGFVIATEVKFTVTPNKETQEIVLVDKVVEMSKQDIDGNEIEGATMIVTSNKTKNIVDKWVSGKEPHKINGLIEGETYTLHEEICIDGYVKASDIEFTVTMEKETQEIVMIDKILEVTKTDLTNGEEIEGAELSVTDEDGNIIDEWISTKEPHKVSGLQEGKTYILTEKTAPYGYEIAESITFTVSTDKETQVIEMKDMPILKSVRVEKIDRDTKEHIKSNKFTFGIYEDEACTKLIKEVGANTDNGTALFDNLRYGTYYIKELKAPLGYKLSDQVVKIEINDKGVFADGVSLEENDGVYEFEYYNSLLPLIQTGNETNYIILGSLAVISLIGIVGGITLLKKKHNKK